MTDAAAVVLDNRSGAVLAYVGSSAELSRAAPTWIMPGRCVRPDPRSSLFSMASRWDEERLTAASLLDYWPVNLEGGSGLYVPDNYDHRFSGMEPACARPWRRR
ncbi:peptidoglycan glycosyltransferase OS=Castellaniella defragrans OX=75697 GN=HNR28_001585 PE=3 SV=1 [Castellaniella defragrans]